MAHSQPAAEVTDLKSLAEMYDSEKFNWVRPLPKTERFTLNGPRVANFDVSSWPENQGIADFGFIVYGDSRGVTIIISAFSRVHARRF